MTLAEFKKEFQQKYDAASRGAPDLNNYEISFYLTEAIRRIVDEAYDNFEKGERFKRILNPLITEKELSLVEYTEDQKFFPGFYAYDITLPGNIYFLLQENAKINIGKNNCSIITEIKVEDLDNLNESMKNPFRSPNKRKILKIESGQNKNRLYSKFVIESYKLRYIKKYTPIILTNFTTDVDLLGTETIDNLNTVSTTELPESVHYKIIDLAVILAIQSLRENNLQTQIQI